MIYSLSVVPFVVVLIFFSALAQPLPEIFRRNQGTFAVFGVLLGANALAWAAGWRGRPSGSDFYIVLLLTLLVLFSDAKVIRFLTRPLLFLMLANVFFCALETQLGLLSCFTNAFHDPYVAVSEFLTSNSGLLSNTDSIIRKVNDYLIFVRPSGLFSNLHLSSFALFCLYAYLDIHRLNKPLRWMLIPLILVGGTMQTMACLVIYVLLKAATKPKKLGISLVLLGAPVFLLLYRLYGPQHSGEYNNMFRIFLDSLEAFRQVPAYALIWGGPVNDILKPIGAAMQHGDMLIESGLLRYTVSFGLVNLALCAMALGLAFSRAKVRDKKAVFFLVATLGTYTHYFMTTTFLGAILVIFVFRSQHLKAGNEELSLDDVESENQDQASPTIFQWIVDTKIASHCLKPNWRN